MTKSLAQTVHPLNVSGLHTYLQHVTLPINYSLPNVGKK